MESEQKVTLKLIDSLGAHAYSMATYVADFRAAEERQISTASDLILKGVASSTQRITEDLSALRVWTQQAVVVDSAGWSRIQRRLRRAAQKLWALHILMGFVVHSSRDQVPEPLAVCMEPVSAKWFVGSSTGSTVVQSDWNLNFSYQDIRRLMKLLTKEPTRSLGVLSFPTAERENLLLNCLLFHEFGHQVDAEKNISGPIAPATDGQAWAEAVTLCDHYQLLRVAATWLSEIASDLIACAAVGPAYFFAFVEFALAVDSPDHAAEDHPSARQRMRTMLDCLACLFTQQPAPFKPELQRWEDYLRGRAEVAESSPVLRAVRESVEPVVPELVSRVAGLAPSRGYDGSRLASDVPAMAQRLAELIPPSDLQGQCCDVVSVLNAAWLCYLECRDALAQLLGWDAKDPTTTVKVRQKINDLATTAIDHVYIRRAWDLSDHGGAQQAGDHQ